MSAVVTLLQIAGLALVTTGAALLAPWAGFVCAGVGCLLLGLALER